MIASVLVQVSNKNVDKTFDYLVPISLTSKIKVGKRVTVPFSNQVIEGFVLKLKDDSNITELKEIKDVIDEEVILNEELLYLGKFMQQETLSTLISCYQAMLPKALKAKRGVNVNKRYDTFYTLNNLDLSITSTKQKEIIDRLKKDGKVLKKDLEIISSSALNTLIKKNVLKEIKSEKYRYILKNDYNVIKYPLTSEQASVVNRVLDSDGFNVFLIHGVTGSGKTEVYMEIIEEKRKLGKTALVLVPEISLTPQMIERFQKRFHEPLAVLHSRLSDGEKYDEWRKIARGEVGIVIGVRSAIFAPLKNLGVIIIDEEHTLSYKQENNPKYHTLTIAKERGRINSCPVLLGSATPSLETFARSKKGVYTYLSLPNRINKKNLPLVKLIDMNIEVKKGRKILSLDLLEEIKNKLEKNEQVILLLNRRGYSSFISCQNCSYVWKCPNCDITLTYHKTSSMLRCHYCGYATKKVDICPECHEKSLIDLGVGTEKVEQMLNEIFKDAKILRMDLDTTTNKGSHERMINDFSQHKYDILLGTQMIAKGLNFENVTLVGVLNADTSLHIPDFRSSENTFQLLSQVAGRSGRGEKEGKVIIQTFNPTHYAVYYSKNHDYLNFYNMEMSIRKKLKYPPYYYLVSIKVMSKDYELCKNEAVKVGNFLKNNLSNTIVLGPSVCSLFKVNNIYRFGIVLKYKKEDKLKNVLNELLNHYQTNSKIKIDIDFDPNHI